MHIWDKAWLLDKSTALHRLILTSFPLGAVTSETTTVMSMKKEDDSCGSNIKQ